MEKEFLFSKDKVFKTPHFYIIWKILKYPDNFLIKLYSEFKNILTDSLELICFIDKHISWRWNVIYHRFLKFIYKDSNRRTNVTYILGNIYLAKLEKLLWDKCKLDTKLIRPILFKRFIDDSFGVTKGSKSDFEYWVSEFYSLIETITINEFKYGDKVDFTDLVIFKGKKFTKDEIHSWS